MINLRHISKTAESNDIIEQSKCAPTLPVTQNRIINLSHVICKSVNADALHSDSYSEESNEEEDEDEVDQSVIPRSRIIKLSHITNSNSNAIDHNNSEADKEDEEDDSSEHNSQNTIRIRPNSDFFHRYVGTLERMNNNNNVSNIKNNSDTEELTGKITIIKSLMNSYIIIFCIYLN